MIAISGGLVLGAAVLLVFGIAGSHLTLVYAAIGLSIVSALFLLVGVFQRPPPARTQRSDRADTDSVTGTGTGTGSDSGQRRPRTRHAEPEDVAEDESVGEFAPADDATAAFPLEAADPDCEADAAATGADVLVVSGRPRYHVAGCEYVEGHGEAEPLEINEARELGFTPCGVCRPDATLARGAAGGDPAGHAGKP